MFRSNEKGKMKVCLFFPLPEFQPILLTIVQLGMYTWNPANVATILMSLLLKQRERFSEIVGLFNGLQDFCNLRVEKLICIRQLQWPFLRNLVSSWPCLHSIRDVFPFFTIWVLLSLQESGADVAFRVSFQRFWSLTRVELRHLAFNGIYCYRIHRYAE